MLSDPITRRALLEVLILALALGPLGVWVLLHRQAYAAESLSHGLLPGLVLAALAGAPLVLGAAGGALVAAGAIALAARDERHRRATSASRSRSRRCSALGALLALAPGGAAAARGAAVRRPARDLAAPTSLAAAALALAVALALAAAHRPLALTAFDRDGRALARRARRRAGRRRCSRCSASARSPPRPGSAACCSSRS